MMNDFFQEGYKPTIHERRQVNKLGLETFPLSHENMLESSADETINKLKKDNDESLLNSKELEKIQSEDPERWKELAQQASYSDIDLEMQILENYSESSYREGTLFAYAEMKIIFAYKQLEISINKLINAAYPSHNNKALFKIENLLLFFTAKGLDITKIKGYKEFDQLRKVNNVLKHNGQMHSKLKDINEFKEKEVLNFTSLEEFYTRIKTYPDIFLKSLSEIIYEDLYEFDDIRINNLVTEFTLRMEKEIVFKFCHQLLGMYNYR